MIGIGIAIGIAALVAILGLSASSKADLNAELDRLGTNLLSVTPGQALFTGANAAFDDAGHETDLPLDDLLPIETR